MNIESQLHPQPIHRPLGAEHPYADSLDQLVPSVPLVGAPLRLGVVVGRETSAVSVEIEWADGGTEYHQLVAAEPDADDLAALVGGEGHLAESQAESLGGDGGWRCDLAPLDDRAGRYRFTVDGSAATGWYELAPARWEQAAASLVTGAGDRLVPDSVALLASTATTHRLRFALRLRPGDHVVGFGERFDAVDQAGRRLDSVVFEQYKSQGALGRTYLPMPFAHVIGADGTCWGFHVRTSRRVWFDVGATSADRLVVEVDLGRDAPGVDVAIYVGDPTAVLGAFLDEVGRAEEQPEWVLRLWGSSNEWNTQAVVEAQARSPRCGRHPARGCGGRGLVGRGGLQPLARRPLHPAHRRLGTQGSRLHLPRRRRLARPGRHDPAAP